jgi:hypothetical protein
MPQLNSKTGLSMSLGETSIVTARGAPPGDACPAGARGELIVGEARRTDSSEAFALRLR